MVGFSRQWSWGANSFCGNYSRVHVDKKIYSTFWIYFFEEEHRFQTVLCFWKHPVFAMTSLSLCFYLVEITCKLFILWKDISIKHCVLLKGWCKETVIFWLSCLFVEMIFPVFFNGTTNVLLQNLTERRVMTEKVLSYMGLKFSVTDSLPLSSSCSLSSFLSHSCSPLLYYSHGFSTCSLLSPPSVHSLVFFFLTLCYFSALSLLPLPSWFLLH